MIEFSAAVSEILNSGNLEYFFVISIGDNIKATTAPFDVTVGGVTYSSEVGVAGVEPPKVSNSVDRAAYKITFVDAQFELKQYFETNSTGDPVKVRLCFFNNLNRTVNGVLEGDYFKDLADTVLIYSGVVDEKAYNIDLANFEVTAVIGCSSPMADLDLVKSFYTQKDTLKLQYPSDTSFDFVYDGATQAVLKWGKA